MYLVLGKRNVLPFSLVLWFVLSPWLCQASRATIEQQYVLGGGKAAATSFSQSRIASTTKSSSYRTIAAASTDIDSAAATVSQIPRGGGGTLSSWLPTPQATARFATVYFWIAALTSAADGTRAWKDIGIQVPHGSLGEWYSERHGWILLSVLTLVLLVQRSTLGTNPMIALSSLPLLFHVFQGLYSGRSEHHGIQRYETFLLGYHATMLAWVFLFQKSLPCSWVADSLWWIISVAGILFPQQSLEQVVVVVPATSKAPAKRVTSPSKKVTTTSSSSISNADQLMWIFHCHAGLLYATAIRVLLLSTNLNGSTTSLSIVKWALTSWVAAIAVYAILRVELGKSVGFIEAGRYFLSTMAVILAALMHQ